MPEGVLLGMGNPLLDISADVPQAVLDKYVSKGTYVCLYVVVFFFFKEVNAYACSGLIFRGRDGSTDGSTYDGLIDRLIRWGVSKAL